MRLARKRALVTGAASGIGRAIALRYAAEGASVVIADIDVDGAERVRTEIADTGGTAIAVELDIGADDRVDAMARRVNDELGGVDILVNNANNMPSDDLLEMSTQAWDFDVRIALRGPYRCVRAMLPGMLEQGSGAIVNISSVNAVGFYGNEAYSAGKAGLISLTRSIAVRYGRNGIRANAIAAGTVRTPVWEGRRELDPEVFDKVASWYPLGRVGMPDDVANAALFLASDEAAWVTGAVLSVDGGLTAGNYRMTTELIPESEF